MPATTASWGNASRLLAAADVEEDPTYYLDFTQSDEKAALTVAMRIQAAWAANDADMFAEVFADNGSLLMQDEQLKSKEEIRAFMAAGFTGPYKGARVKGWPVAVKFLDDNVAMVITEGGILLSGEKDIPPERSIRATWVIAKRPDGQLELVSHQSSPVKG